MSFMSLQIYIIHSFSGLSYDKSKASSKANSPRSAIYSFLLQMRVSLRSYSSFVRLLPRLPVTYITPFIFPSITRCRRQFLRKMWPIQLAFRLLISCRIYLCSCNVRGYIYIYIYLFIYILRGFKTSVDVFRLSYSIAFDCSICPFLDLFHSWL